MSAQMTQYDLPVIYEASTDELHTKVSSLADIFNNQYKQYIMTYEILSGTILLTFYTNGEDRDSLKHCIRVFLYKYSLPHTMQDNTTSINVYLDNKFVLYENVPSTNRLFNISIICIVFVGIYLLFQFF